MGAIQQMLAAESASVSGSTYATWNPADKKSSIVLSNGDLTAAFPSDTAGLVRGTVGVSSGKWYWEITINTPILTVGAGKSTTDVTTGTIGFDAGSCGYLYNGQILYAGSNKGTYSSLITGNVIGIALDMDGLTLAFYRNNTLQYSWAVSAGTYYPMVGPYISTGGQVTANFGATALTYTPPSGYNAGLYI